MKFSEIAEEEFDKDSSREYDLPTVGVNEVDTTVGCTQCSAPPPERAILIDLIAEIVDEDGEGHEIGGVDDDCLVCIAVTRAAARLREVNGE